MKITKGFSIVITIMLLSNILIAQDLAIKKTTISLFKNNSLFVGIAKSNLITSSFDNIAYQVGLSRKLVITNNLNLNNELSFVKIPYENRFNIGNYRDNINFFEIGAIPEFQFSNSIMIGAAPSLNYLLKSNLSSYFYPTWRTLSIGGNSYVGISINDFILKFRYNINSIDSKKTSSYFGLNIEYRFDL